jgi:hypothetical protein
MDKWCLKSRWLWPRCVKSMPGGVSSEAEPFPKGGAKFSP